MERNFTRQTIQREMKKWTEIATAQQRDLYYNYIHNNFSSVDNLLALYPGEIYSFIYFVLIYLFMVVEHDTTSEAFTRSQNSVFTFDIALVVLGDVIRPHSLTRLAYPNKTFHSRCRVKTTSLSV